MSVQEFMAGFVFGMAIFYFGLSFYLSWKRRNDIDNDLPPIHDQSLFSLLRNYVNPRNC